MKIIFKCTKYPKAYWNILSYFKINYFETCEVPREKGPYAAKIDFKIIDDLGSFWVTLSHW